MNFSPYGPFLPNFFGTEGHQACTGLVEREREFKWGPCRMDWLPPFKPRIIVLKKIVSNDEYNYTVGLFSS